jgi:hypothetical protein
MLIFAGARVALVAWPFDYWFIGHCVGFLLCGVFFAFNLVDHYLPLPSRSNQGGGRGSARHVGRMMRVNHRHPKNSEYFYLSNSNFKFA